MQFQNPGYKSDDANKAQLVKLNHESAEHGTKAVVSVGENELQYTVQVDTKKAVYDPLKKQFEEAVPEKYRQAAWGDERIGLNHYKPSSSFVDKMAKALKK